MENHVKCSNMNAVYRCWLQIPVHIDLPVGHNLQDHITVVGLEYLLSNKIGSSEQKSKSLMALFDYFVFGKGVISSFPFAVLLDSWYFCILLDRLPVWSLGCKNRPAPFPGRMSYKATKPGPVSVLYLSMRYALLLFIRVYFYVSLVFVAMCSVFWLFWLSYQYLLSDWLERLL